MTTPIKGYDWVATKHKQRHNLGELSDPCHALDVEDPEGTRWKANIRTNTLKSMVHDYGTEYSLKETLDL